MFRNEAGAQRLIVSSSGFTAGVRERAAADGIQTQTYEELFKSFEQTHPYLDHILGSSNLAGELKNLDRIYEEPNFEDKHGTQVATGYLNDWLAEQDPHSPWLIVVGEYGTGKTALTRVLQRRWALKYQNGENPRIPFRVELKNFSRQFDARGLLHYFLDHNELPHLPVAFVESMIANGRVVLLLDGYDEMAQYLNVRERRACLQALADLATEGARGLLTSRPNYFTQAEELRVFEVLYKRIQSRGHIAEIDKVAIEQERNVDRLLEKFVLNRVERSLRDLTDLQTADLIRRQLSDDPDGAQLVLDLLSRVFRSEEGRELSLSGKPVIVTYLLEVVDELKKDRSNSEDRKLTEWDIYDLIVENLMKRDFNRAHEFFPSERKKFLQLLALRASLTQTKTVDEEAFRALIRIEFESKLARRRAEGAADVEDSLFDDLRSSATLTRNDDTRVYTWQFSHNSLREFLLVSYLVDRLVAGQPELAQVAITEQMVVFSSAMPQSLFNEMSSRFASLWSSRNKTPELDRMFTVVWPAERKIYKSDRSARDSFIRLTGNSLDITSSKLANINFSPQSNESTDFSGISAANVDLLEVCFDGVELSGGNFSNSAMDACTFVRSDLTGANFRNSFILDCDLTDAICKGADFRSLDPDSRILIQVENGVRVLEGGYLLGYLQSVGADTDEVDPYYSFVDQPIFGIVEKICRVLAEPGWHQRLGIEQRGVAKRNVRVARKFVDYLIATGYVEVKGGTGGSLLGSTASGRPALSKLVDGNSIDAVILSFLEDQIRR